ncbi:hypothetical protein OEZ86_006491 [Tetradesmus obliquus]|nr:hypothetical protein OEZ86_006491 [Tetradesmus obliquus]
MASRLSGAKAAAAAAAAGSISSAAGGVDSSTMFGVGCVALSALLFSVLGVMYEVLMSADQTHSVTQAQASAAVTGVSLVAALAHQLYYTLPNLGLAVLQPVAASSHSAASIAGSHVLYGVITAAHQLLQVQLLSSQGAMAVGLVNAVRASVVSFVSSWFFCSSMAHLCLSYWRAVGAMVVTAGAALWVVAGKPMTRRPLQKKLHTQ